MSSCKTSDLKYFKLDYLNFTYFKEGSNDLFQDFLDDFPEIESRTCDMIILRGGKGLTWGYNNVFAFTDFITIRYDDRDSSRGLCVSITARGLETFFSWFNTLSDDDGKVAVVFKLLKDRGCRPSRIDLAFDDESKTFTPDQYERWLLEGYFNTKMKKHGFFCDDKKGYTFYLGSRRKKLIRIYDKDKESDGEINAIRYEFELHGLYAEAMFDQIIDENIPAFGDLILDSFRIINPDSDSNISRCEMLVEWEDFVKSTLTQNYVTVTHYKRYKNINNLQRWIEHDVMPSLKAYELFFGRSWLLHELSRQELNDKGKRLLIDYLI